MPISALPPFAFWTLTSTTWVVLWSVLTVMTIALVVMLRTRWSGVKPWRKCAILSLWVHVLLGCIATTVRIVTGAPELGNDEPIRVAVMPAAVEHVEKIDEITPEWELPTDPPALIPVAEPLEPLPLPTDEALPPLPELQPESQSETETTEPAPPLEIPDVVESFDAAEPSADVLPERAEQLPAEAQTSAEDLPTETTNDDKSSEQQVTTPVAEPPPLPSTYADRFAKDRDALVEQRGGSEQTEQAVRAALDWLASAQSENGGWDASRFGAGAARVVLNQDRRGAGAQADTGVTGLALLAFLGAGHTHRGGEYSVEVARGLEYLRQRQRSDGSLYGEANFFARMYCHSMATFAVCEALALTHDERLEPMARAAVRYTLSMQHPTDGGWRYQRGDTGDTSQLGWQMMALKSAQLAGIDVPQVTWTRVDHFLSRVRRGNAGGLAAYRPDSLPSTTMTAEALFCRQLQQSQQLAQLSDESVNEAVAKLGEELPTASRRNLYFWYYATLALHGNRLRSAEAAAAWEAWNHALTTTLLTTQQADGSWDVNTAWGGCGGRVYTTAISALCLEVYYRYNPVQQPSPVADRESWHNLR